TSRGGFPGNGTMPDGFPGSDDAADSAEASETESNVGDNSAADGGEAEAEEETSIITDRLNQEKIILTEKDVQDIRKYISGIRDVTISYSTRASVEGGQLTDAQTYTLAGVKDNYADISKLSLMDGTFFTEEDDEIRSRSCVLGASAAKEIFGSTQEVVGETIYIEDRTYTVTGVFEASATVASNVSTDTAIFVPYETGIKYITGEEIDPIITVIAEDVDVLDSVIEKTRIVLEENYSNAVFTFEDSGSKMQAAKASNRTLTMLLSAMAAIVFFVGGIGIMNVLFVSIKERTNEIGILKAIGMKQSKILLEFLTESAAISFLGGMIGCGISYVLIPVMEHFGIRIETNLAANLTALAFSVLTGTVFGIYPAWKASRLEPVDALNSE
ncbi:MAG: ABC transporter permease, partial [Blautia sp.]|nr:ABC transporter permease [Blautia sp.]